MVKKIETPEERNWLLNYISGLSYEKSWMVKVVQFRKKRTVKQNSLYHVWKSVIYDEGELGYTEKELHDVLRAEYLGYKEVEYKGRKVQILRSTTDLNTKEFTDFLDSIYRDFSAEGIVLPLPDQQGFEEMFMKYST